MRKMKNRKRYSTLVLGFILIAFVLIYISGSRQTNPYSQAHNEAELKVMLEQHFVIGETKAADTALHLEQADLECTDYAFDTYDADFSEQPYNASIVCRIPAPNAALPRSSNVFDAIANELVSEKLFRVVFLFEDEILVNIRLFLDILSP